MMKGEYVYIESLEVTLCKPLLLLSKKKFPDCDSIKSKMKLQGP